jgi:hypothetical protein
MVSQACLDNIVKKGSVYCDTLNPVPPGDPTFCGEIQTEISELCKQHSYGPEVPVIQNSPNGKCYCCCSCFAYRTPIQVGAYADEIYKFVENIKPGEEVLTTDPTVSKWGHSKVTEIGGIAPEIDMDFMFYISFSFEDGEQSSIIVTADHLFLLPNGKLRSAKNLRAGDQIRQADGGTASVKVTSHGSWSGGVRSLSLGTYQKGDPLDGHLLNSNGVITADLSVQSIYYQTQLDDLADEISRAPVGSPQFFAEADTTTYTEFLNTPEMWPLNFTPTPQELIKIPLSAKGYLTPDQARDVGKNMPVQDPSNSYPIVRAQYVFSIARAYYPGIIYLIDWNNDLPNAWYFTQSKQNFVIVSGGLARLPTMDTAGLSLILSNLIARHLGAKCSGSADYTGSFDVMRQMWLDDLYIDMLNSGLDQVRGVFDLINPKNREEDPNDICAQPSTQCRIDTILSGSMSRGEPDCAIPPPPFILAGAESAAANEVTLTFSKKVDPVTVRNRKNYSFTPAAKVKRARTDAGDQSKVTLTVSGLTCGDRYTVKVKDVLDERGQSLSTEHNSAQFLAK